MNRQRKWQLKMKEQGRCQSCGIDSGGKSKCELCKPIYRPRKKAQQPINSWKKEKPIQLKSGAELLAGLEMPEYIQGNDMGEAWTR